MFCDLELLEFLLLHPLAGGSPDEGDPEPGDGESPGEPKPEEGEPQPGDTGKPPTEGHWIPKRRFDEVNQGYNQYKIFGRPEDIQRKLARLTELEQLPQNRTTDKEKVEIRKELLNVFPELQVMSQMFEVQRTAYTDRGADLNNDFLKEIGIEVNDQNNRNLQELLSGIIASDPKLLRRFYALDDSVFKTAFETAKKTFWPNARRPMPGAQIQGKKIPPKAPTQQKPGEKPKPGETIDRMGERDLLDKASEDAFAMLEASRTE